MKFSKQYIKLLSAGLLVAVIAVGCGNAITDPVQEEATSDHPVQQIHRVEISQMKFLPAAITVNRGDKIEFVNKDMVAHDITELGNKKWSSGPLQPDNSWTLEVLDSATYYCSLHEVMRGKIVIK